ncbi:MAG: nucleotide exchange factor GrpE [Geminicoccaceae bacterium]
MSDKPTSTENDKDNGDSQAKPRPEPDHHSMDPVEPVDLHEAEIPSEPAEDTGSGDPESELSETKDHLLRTLADMENLRKRSQREVEEARRYAVTNFARDLLDVADNLSRALSSIPEEMRHQDGFAKTLAEGIEMTENSLKATFERYQVRTVEPAKGDKFDHKRHQAMFEVPTNDVPAGHVAEVMQAGYVLADRLLRPAMVGVAKASTDQEAAKPADDDDPSSRGEQVDTSA